MNKFAWLLTLALAGSLTHCNFSDTRQDDDPDAPPRSGDGQAQGPGSQDPGQGPEAYAQLQAELFNTTCARCHNPGRSAGGVDLTTYAPVKLSAERALAEIEAGSMPPSGTAVAPELTQGLKCWIAQGAPESGATDCFAATASGTSTGTGTGASTSTGTGQGTGTSTGSSTGASTGTDHEDDHHDDDDDDGGADDHHRQRRGGEE